MKYDSMWELEEELFGDFRVTHRWTNEDGTPGSQRYHSIKPDEVQWLIASTEERERRLHLL